MKLPSQWYPFSLLAISAIGFIDATYLTVQHYTDFTLPCTITHGCDLVTKSEYSSIMGVPVALLGALFYVGIFLATYIILETKTQKNLRFVAYSTIAGFLFSLWFMYVQAFIIHAFCQYCILSAITSTTLFILSMVYVRRVSQKKSSPKTSDPSPLPIATHEE